MRLSALGPFAAWLLTSGLWLVVLALAASAISAALAAFADKGLREAMRRTSARLDAIAPRSFACGLFAAALVAMLALVPVYRWRGEGLLGDEPKYLRILDSLYYDLDTDVGNGTREPPTAAGALRNLAWVARTTVEAASGIFGADPIPPDHAWHAGHLTVAGRNGGLYHLQSPGLPFVLLPAVAIQRAFWPEVTAPALPLAMLAALWAFGLAQGVLLAGDVSGSRAAGLIAGLAIAFSAPVFLCGYHFYPEAAALALVPWLLRRAILEGRGTLSALGSGLAIAALPWLHVKFSLLAVAMLAALGSRTRGARAIGALVAPVIAAFALLALYHHRITGLFAPDALYRRYGTELYAGPADFLSADTVRGFLIAFVGAVDGLFMMAPVTIAGALACVALFRRDRRRALVLAAAVTAIAMAAAVHGGGAPGPPGRLLAPVACALGAPIAAGLVQWRGWPSYRWAFLVLTVAGLSITVTMRDDWRRAVSPYRRMFASPEVDFTRLLPGMPGQDREARRGPDVARALALVAIIASWSWWCARPKRADAGRTVAAHAAALRDTHLAFWATIAAGTLVLSALGP